jgi:hypothetical protein
VSDRLAIDIMVALAVLPGEVVALVTRWVLSCSALEVTPGELRLVFIRRWTLSRSRLLVHRYEPCAPNRLLLLLSTALHSWLQLRMFERSGIVVKHPYFEVLVAFHDEQDAERFERALAAD